MPKNPGLLGVPNGAIKILGRTLLGGSDPTCFGAARRNEAIDTLLTLIEKTKKTKGNP